MPTVTLRVNGVERTAQVPTTTTLLELLRDEFDVTGVKRGCELAECGVCMVQVDGMLKHACLTLAVLADGSDVLTNEGLGGPGALHPIQQAFVDHHGFQCGFCTNGQIMAALALLQENPNPTEQEIKAHMVGNLCRCTGYYKIVESIQAAAVAMRGGEGAEPRPGLPASIG